MAFNTSGNSVPFLESALGPSRPCPGELLRVSVPEFVPEEFVGNSKDIPYSPEPFTTDGRGVSIRQVLTAGTLCELVNVPFMVGVTIPDVFWLHFRWPAYEKYAHTVCICHDGTIGSLLLAVAEAYAQFLQEARGWLPEFKNPRDRYWRLDQGPNITFFDDDSVYLKSLVCVNENIFQVEVDIVKRLFRPASVSRQLQLAPQHGPTSGSSNQTGGRVPYQPNTNASDSTTHQRHATQAPNRRYHPYVASTSGIQRNGLLGGHHSGSVNRAPAVAPTVTSLLGQLGNSVVQDNQQVIAMQSAQYMGQAPAPGYVLTPANIEDLYRRCQVYIPELTTPRGRDTGHECESRED